MTNASQLNERADTPISAWWALISATKWRIDRKKRSPVPDGYLEKVGLDPTKGARKHRGDILRRWNNAWLTGEALTSALLIVLTLCCGLTPNKYLWLQIPFTYLFISRTVEIVTVFYSDPFRVDKRSNLRPSERIKMAMKSYVGLVINFAYAYYFFPYQLIPLHDGPAFDAQLGSFLDALYFSGITIATIGYGDISPCVPIAKLLVLCESGSGLLLIAVALATYLGEAGKGDTRREAYYDAGIEDVAD